MTRAAYCCAVSFVCVGTHTPALPPEAAMFCAASGSSALYIAAAAAPAGAAWPGSEVELRTRANVACPAAVACAAVGSTGAPAEVEAVVRLPAGDWGSAEPGRVAPGR